MDIGVKHDQISERLEPRLFRTGPWSTRPYVLGLGVLSFMGVLWIMAPRGHWFRPGMLIFGGVSLVLFLVEVYIQRGIFLARRRLLKRLVEDSSFLGAEEVVMQHGLHIELGSIDLQGFGATLGSGEYSNAGESADAGATALILLRFREGREIDLGESRSEAWAMKLGLQVATVLGMPLIDERRGRKKVEGRSVRLPAGIRPLDRS